LTCEATIARGRPEVNIELGHLSIEFLKATFKAIALIGKDSVYINSICDGQPAVGLVRQEQLVKQATILNHRSAEVFCCGVPVFMALCYLISSTITLHERGIMNGDVCRALFEVCRWVSAISHNAADQSVCVADFGQVIYKATLDGSPLRCVGSPQTGCEEAEAECLNPLVTFRQYRFGTTDVTILLENGAIKLGTEVAPELLSPAAVREAQHSPNDNRYYCNRWNNGPEKHLEGPL